MTTKNRRVCVVTGASRGAGRGIALALGSAGDIVYVTGRTERSGEAALSGTIYETAEAVTANGGIGIAVRCDHSDDEQVKALFERVKMEQGGRLDILVNNVTFLHDELINLGGFWEKPLDLVDILDVGLRSQYIASWYAAPLMVEQRRGLIIFTSSFGSACYMHGPAYGAQKAGVDKFAADMAVDLREYGVASISIWMGMLLTERSRSAAKLKPEQYSEMEAVAENPEFTGHIISALYEDPKLLNISGQTIIGAEQAVKYGIRDRDGRTPPSHRSALGDPRIPSPAIVR